MLEHYKTFYPKPKNTDGLKKSLAVNMGPDAAGLNQQGHIEVHKKTSSLCELKDEMDIYTVFQKTKPLHFWQ